MNIELTGTEAKVCKDIAERQKLGLKKYGVSVSENPLSLRQWLEHAYQECLDQAIYLKRAMEEMDDSSTTEHGTRNTNKPSPQCPPTP